MWEGMIAMKGITIDRAAESAHPSYPEIVYPIDYGYVNETISVDGEELDIFVGTASNGLIGAIFTTDFRKDDQECKLIFNCTPQEIYLVNGFINFNQSLMQGKLLLRHEMRTIWTNRG